MEGETREQIKDRPINYVGVTMRIESGCDPKIGEYGLNIDDFIGSLDISSIGGIDDISLVKECIENDFDFEKAPSEGFINFVLRESGEWEGYSWNKYYVIERFTIEDYYK